MLLGWGLSNLDAADDFAAFQYLPALKRALGHTIAHLLALLCPSMPPSLAECDTAAVARITAALTSDGVCDQLAALWHDGMQGSSDAAPAPVRSLFLIYDVYH
jgi:hypothetical protein